MDAAVEGVRADCATVSYESHAIPQSAPGHLAAIAHVFGLDTPATSSARVLEFGCGSGANVIPFAACHPNARVVGIDSSQVQLDQGLERVRELGLTNVELRRGDVTSVEPSDLGRFDFIICHAVFSRMPEPGQEAMLSAVRRLLTPDGVAYVSYHVYPGWKAQEIVRDAMLLRGGERATAGERLSYAQGMLDFLAEVSPADGVMAKALADFGAIRAGSPGDAVMHEYLQAFHAPCYFLEFGKRCEPHSLSYLADACPQTMFPVNYGANVAEPLLRECGHSQMLVEQYLDFFVNRTFRQSLLVHCERAPQIRYQLHRSRFRALHFAAWLPPLAEATRLDASDQEYGRPEANLFTADPGVKAALDALTARWPWTLSRPELLYGMHSRLAAAGVEPSVDQNDRVDELLEALIMRGMASYRLEPVVAKPMGHPWRFDEPLRRIAELVQWAELPLVFNRWHEEVLLPPIDRHLLPLLDGTRDRDALADELMTLLRDDVIRFERDGSRLWGEVELRAAALEYIDATPLRLAQLKLG